MWRYAMAYLVGSVGCGGDASTDTDGVAGDTDAPGDT